MGPLGDRAPARGVRRARAGSGGGRFLGARVSGARDALPSDAAIGLAALVVTYQRLGPLQRTVARLRAEPVDRICIVDNGSTDGTREWLSSLDEPRLRLIHAPRNLGGAGGFETGLRLLTEQDDPDWVLLMDDDARPRPGAVAAFRAGRPWSWDVVSAAVYGPCGGIAEINRPTVNPFWDGATFWISCRRPQRWPSYSL